jgi:hypothetical protein
MSRWIATALLLTLGLGVPAQAKTPAAGAASPRHGGVLEELTAYGAALFVTMKDGNWCGQSYCPTPPPPPPPGQHMSFAAFKPLSKPGPVRKGPLP